METNPFSLLKTRRMLPLFITQFFGAFNDNIFKNALVALVVYQLADKIGANSKLLPALASGIFILPFFLFSAIAGELADKFEKVFLIRIIKTVEIPLMITAAAAFHWKSVPLLLLVLFGLGMHSTFFGPLKYATLPSLLPEDELIAANGLIETGTFLAILFGTLIGGDFILHTRGNTQVSSWLILMAIGGWLASFFIPKTHGHDPALKLHFNVVRETGRLLQYAHARWDLFLTILAISWIWLIGIVMINELPLFAAVTLHTSHVVYLTFLTIFSIGMSIGSLMCNKLLKGKVHATYVPLGALGITVFMIDLYFASRHGYTGTSTTLLTVGGFLHKLHGWRISVDLFLTSVCAGIYTVPLYTILQARCEPQHRARIIASNNIMNALFMVVGSLGAAALSMCGFSIPQIFLALAIANGVVALRICQLLPDALVKGFFRWLFTSLYRVEVKGLEHYEAAGDRTVIISNHTSVIDAVLLAAFLPDKLTFAINTFTAKKWWIRAFLSLVDAFHIDPVNPMAVKSLIEFIRNNNKRCVIFPEGRLTMTGALMKIYEGPGLVADKSGAHLLPIRIQGAQLTPFSRLRGKVRIQWAPKITINIFPAEPMDIPASVKGRLRRQKISYKLYDIMTNMMFASSDYQKPLYSTLLDARNTQGRRFEIIEDNKRSPLTYQQFVTYNFILGDKIARATAIGESVGVLLPTTTSTAVVFFAMQAYCRVPAMLNYTAGSRNVVLACQMARIKTVYSSREFVKVGKLNGIIRALRNADITVIYLEDLKSQISGWHKFLGVCKAQLPRLTYYLMTRKPHIRALCGGDAPAVILFTSGSEGTPKGVVLSHANLQANRCQLGACIDFNAGDKVFNSLPVFHAFGMMGGMLLPLLTGIRVFFYPSPLHYRIVPELCYDTNATILFGTDTFLAGYAKYAHPYDFYSVRYVFAGAEKLREETRAVWSHKFGVRIFEGYGATEAAPIISVNTPMQHRGGSVGRLLPGIRARLVPVPGIAEGGVLHIQGPNIMQGYLTVAAPGVVTPVPEGWYDTGDVVTLDNAEFVTITGRVKRFAKVAGEMISLTMVEQQVSLLWPKEQHAVVSLPDAKKGEQLVLITTRLAATRDEVAAFFKENGIADLAIPKKVLSIKDMFLTGTGKVDYVKVKEWLNGNWVEDAPEDSDVEDEV